MKKFLLSTVVLTLGLSISARAQSWFPFDEDFGTGMPLEERIDYLSWCEGHKVMTSNNAGEVVAKWDCAQVSNQARCVEKSVLKGDVTIISATCQ